MNPSYLDAAARDPAVLGRLDEWLGRLDASERVRWVLRNVPGPLVLSSSFGRAPGRYDLRLGADFRGERLNRIYRENIDEAAILAALDPLFARYAAERGEGEGFGDFLVRIGEVSAPQKIPVKVTA